MHILSRVKVFIEVARLQSFSTAGKALGISGPAASKHIMALEEELGVKLLHRTTRMVTLTDEGQIYYEQARHALDILQEATTEIRDMKSIPKGSLKVSAPLSFSHMHLLPAFAGFAAKYPDVHMQVVLEDRAVDVIAEGYDMVIRIGVLTDSGLIVKKLADCPISAVASPAYCKEYTMPRHPDELKKHRMIGYSLQGSGVEWKYIAADGNRGSVKCNAAFHANTAEMMLQAALDGVGIALLPSFTTATYLSAGKLMPVLPDYYSFPERQIVALMPPNRYRSAKVTLFLDWLIAACKTLPDTVVT